MRYLESVSALQIAREHGPDWLLGAALNPFKYREEEGGAQYLKARKKLLAGADFLTRNWVSTPPSMSRPRPGCARSTA